MNPLNFYIVYTPRTVELVEFFIWSLLRYSDCDYCLVSNACLEKEKKILQANTQLNPRLTFLDLPTTEIWEHGKVLNFLFERNKAEYFCFMDSDIFAVGPFMDQFLKAMPEHILVSSCPPIWMEGEDKILLEHKKNMSGKFIKTSNGILLGCTYFAIYNTDKVKEIITSYNIDFKRFFWDELSDSNQKMIGQLNLKKRKYDTAKVLSLAFVYQKEKIHFSENEALIHIGGLSCTKSRNRRPKYPKSPTQSFIFSIRLWKNILKDVFHSFSAPKLYRSERKIWRIKYHKNIINDYFINLLQNLVKQREIPKLPKVKSSIIKKSLEKATAELVFLHNNMEQIKSK